MPDPSPRTPIASAPLSVLLFAHALSTETQDAVRAWLQYLDTLSRPYEIFLIQETRPEVTPTDDPPDAVKPTRVFSFDRALGFRDALNEAIRAAQHPLVAFCPADKQYVPGDLDRMLKRIDEVDIVAGFRVGQAPFWRVLLDTVIGLSSRLVIGVPIEPRRCWFGSTGWSRRWLARWIFGVHVMDPECPFRLARREIFEHLPIQSGGPFVQVEMLAKANHLSCYLAEEEVAWTPPALPQSDAITFGQDANAVFWAPDFGPYQDPHLALAPANEPGRSV